MFWIYFSINLECWNFKKFKWIKNEKKFQKYIFIKPKNKFFKTLDNISTQTEDSIIKENNI